MVRNVHERLIPAPSDEVGTLLDALGGAEDRLWPSPAWEPMVMDRGAAVGSRGGHGSIRYHVTAYEPGRRVEFTLDDGQGLHGTHALVVEPAGPSRTLLRHVAHARLSGIMLLLWPMVVRPMHDAVLEDLLDRAETIAGRGPVPTARWTPWVRLLRRVENPRARAAEVPATAPLGAALPRVDRADAYAVDCRPGMPTDPQVWADATFCDAPRAVVWLLAVRQALVGLIGVERDDGTAFDTLVRTDGEVLLGTDAGHLDFRASVLREPGRVVLSTVVQVHNRRGRLYSAIVRRVHPIVVRAMLTRAAGRLAEESTTAAGFDYEPP